MHDPRVLSPHRIAASFTCLAQVHLDRKKYSIRKSLARQREDGEVKEHAR